VSDGPAETGIAVVGMAGRFPGAGSVDELWQNVRNGVESVRRFTDEELEASGVESALLRDPHYVKAGAVLEDFDRFDASFFGIGAKDAAIMDPQHRHFLECAWEALEHAGHPPRRFPGSIGVFGGCGMNAYFIRNLLTNPQLLNSVGLFLLRHTSNDKDFLATLVSYKLDLTGPSLSIQTACSTSLVAIHVACQSLLNGECDLALAGGSTIHVPHHTGYLYKEGEVLSPDGHCRAFEARSRGTVFGSGAGVVVLRRLQDALEDRDCIHAVIRASAINNDGSFKAGYLAPSLEGQARVVAEALSMAGVDAGSISYVEAHGTGTAVGDPIEVGALTQVFRQDTSRQGFCTIGSIKPNIGHLDTAAGVASFIKAVQALKHRELPPCINYSDPNPEIDFEGSPFLVSPELKPWPPGETPRRAGVSSLGVGGTNAHVILEEAPEPATSAHARPVQLLTLSARTASALEASAARLAQHLDERPEQDLADVAHTLAVGRQAFDRRRIVVCRDHPEAIALLGQGRAKGVVSAALDREADSVAFLFPGGGAQYPRMGLGLYRTEPVFREHVDRGLELLKHQLGADVKALLFAEEARASEAAREFERPSIQLPAIFVIEYALAKLWMSWGVRPAALMGHSVGENAAACFAGVLSFEDALGLVALRGRLVEQVAPGGMVSVALTPEELEPLLGDQLNLACVNCPSLCVVSGRVADLERLEARLEERGAEYRRIGISVAGHSSMLDPILDEFRSYLERIPLNPPELPIVSNLTGTWIREEEATAPDYWVRHFRHTVRFSEGIATLLETSGRALVEVGPGRTLSSIVRQHPAGSRAQTVLPSLRHADEKVDDLQFQVEALGRLWLSGVEIDWERFYAKQERRRVPIPTYPFERQRYWIEPGRPVYEGPGAESPLEKLALDDWFSRPVWKLAELAQPNAEPAAKLRWLIFLDTGGLGSEMVERLRAEGHEVLTVREGDAFYRFSSEEYALAPETGREGYDLLVQSLVVEDRLPDRIVHLWMVTPEASARAGSSFFHRNQERGFYSLFFLAQTLGDEGLRTPLQITVVSNGLHRVGAEDLTAAEKATLLGPVRVMPRELPLVQCRSIDVVLPPLARRRFRAHKHDTPLTSLATKLLAETQSSSSEPLVAYRNEGRWVQEFERFSIESDGRGRLREEGVYLVTGGLGGIGFALSEHLARSLRARLVLVGRSEFPRREEWDAWLETHGSRDRTSERIRRIRDLEALGAEVMVATGDVANIERMKEILAEARSHFGELHGVIHAAGTLEDGVIQRKTPEDVEAVFTPKVHGTLVLAELLEDCKLDFFLLFSSTSSFLGPPGQVEYAAANSFLNAFAESRAAAGHEETVAVNWGVWSGVGMAAELGRRLRGAADGAGARELASHPLLEERLTEGKGPVTYAAEYRSTTHWVLDEHRTQAGQALLPGTCYLELGRAALADAGVAGPIELRDVVFVSPLRIDDAGREVRVELVPLSSGRSFEVKSVTDDSRAGEVHAEGTVDADRSEDPEPLSPAQIGSRCGDRHQEAKGSALATPQEQHLAFGPRWRSLRSVGFGSGEALAELELPKSFEGDLETYWLHPALLDVATGFALPLAPGYQAGQALYVPLGCERVRVRGPLRRQLYSHARLRSSSTPDLVAFDVTVSDREGKVLVAVEGFTFKRLEDPTAFAEVVTPKAPEELTMPAERGSVAERSFLESLEVGIRAEEGIQSLERVLGGLRLPQVVVSSVELERLVERTGLSEVDPEQSDLRFERPELQSAYEPPRDDIERTIAGYWEELLGIDEIGIHDDFFELGGHSLIAVRLFAKLKKSFGVEYPLSILFEAPTIAKCAELLRAEGEDAAGEPTEGEPTTRAQRFLVPMHVGSEPAQPPFFLVSGMFGNVLNLRHLAAHLGPHQPVYAIQARGLYGEDAPHTRFEEMARDYLEEVRSLQPVGPYYLGGFSGGGISAFEMAQQLLAEGEEVALLVMLDSLPPQVPTLGMGDRIQIQWQRLQRNGPRYLWEWARNRARWEIGRVRKLFYEAPEELTPAEFRSAQIEQAFREALGHYQPQRYPGRIALFRPALDEAHFLRRNRVASSRRELVDPRNFWMPFCGGVDVHEVSGDHDRMVLEPHVRVLAAGLRTCLEEAQRKDLETGSS
jgi:acyl transferase domain-containing protein